MSPPPHHIRVPLWKSPPLPQSPLISDPVRTRSRAPGTPEEPKWHTGWETLTYTTVYGQMFHILTSRLYPLVEHSIQIHGMGLLWKCLFCGHNILPTLYDGVLAFWATSIFVRLGTSAGKENLAFAIQGFNSFQWGFVWLRSEFFAGYSSSSMANCWTMSLFGLDFMHRVKSC